MISLVVSKSPHFLVCEYKDNKGFSILFYFWVYARVSGWAGCLTMWADVFGFKLEQKDVNICPASCGWRSVMMSSLTPCSVCVSLKRFLMATPTPTHRHLTHLRTHMTWPYDLQMVHPMAAPHWRHMGFVGSDSIAETEILMSLI